MTGDNRGLEIAARLLLVSLGQPEPGPPMSEEDIAAALGWHQAGWVADCLVRGLHPPTEARRMLREARAPMN